MTTKDVAVIDAEIVGEIEPLSEGKAKVLDKRIRLASIRVADNTAQLLDLLEEAANGKIHVALGYPSWPAYIKDAVNVSPADDSERKALVSLMSGKGMSVRAIADVVGVGKSTVSRDLADEDVPDGTPTTGVDGKEYKRAKVADDVDEPLDVEEVQEPRKATDVIDDFGENMDYLMPNVAAFNDILRDDAELFPKARKRIAQRFGPRLHTAIADLQKILDVVME